MPASDYITIREAADRLERSPETVRRYVADGLIDAEKIGSQWVLDANDVDDFAEALADDADDGEDADDCEDEDENDDAESDDDDEEYDE